MNIIMLGPYLYIHIIAIICVIFKKYYRKHEIQNALIDEFDNGCKIVKKLFMNQCIEPFDLLFDLYLDEFDRCLIELFDQPITVAACKKQMQIEL